MKHIEGLLLTSSGTISAPGLRPAFQLPRATPRYKGRSQHVFKSYNAGPRCRHPFPPQLLKLYSKKHILCTDGKRVAMDHGGNSGSSFRKVPRWPLVQGSWPSGHDHSMYLYGDEPICGKFPASLPCCPYHFTHYPETRHRLAIRQGAPYVKQLNDGKASFRQQGVVGSNI